MKREWEVISLIVKAPAGPEAGLSTAEHRNAPKLTIQSRGRQPSAQHRPVAVLTGGHDKRPYSAAWPGDQYDAVRAGVAIYCLVVGVLMAAWWAVDIRRGALARDRARPEIILHLAAELVTAALLVAGGAVLLAGGITGVALAGLGMLLYTVIASPGYFIARHQWAPAAMFAVLAILSAAAIAWLLVM